MDSSKVSAVLQHKWSKDIMDEGYIPFPKRLLRVLPQFFGDVSLLQVVLAVVDYSRPDLTHPASYEHLAFMAGMPVEEFRKGVTRLKQIGWVKTMGPEDAVWFDLDRLKELITDATTN
ncbi:hypothetical protein [Fuerstiella marisgermanici]|uniref:hypothetical protein n=1 Tax=Fuerstiella marisgermanici TaxID=1891926 RepID=UPI0011AB4CCA|nr:hypothetical protein [Fuerstiella marisgermanici]